MLAALWGSMKTDIFVTNKTPFQIAICGHSIQARAVDQRLSVVSAIDFQSAVESIYPEGELTVSVGLLKGEVEGKNDGGNSNGLALSDLNLPEDLIETLAENDINTIESLTELTLNELNGKRGIGSASIGKIETALKEHNLTLKGESDDK